MNIFIHNDTNTSSYSISNNGCLKPARPRTILIDADDTLYDTLPAFLYEYNRLTGENVKFEDINTWDMDDILKEPQYIDIIFRNPDFFEGLKLKPYAKEIVEKLNKIHNVYIVTSGQTCSFIGKERAIKRDFPFLKPEQVVFCWNKGLYKGDVLIDDRVLFHQQFQKTNPKGLSVIMDMPHNRFCDVPHVRATNFAEVGTIISLYIKNNP